MIVLPVFDNTILSAFTTLGKINFLSKLFNTIIIPELVYIEFKVKWNEILENEFEFEICTHSKDQLDIGKYTPISGLSNADKSVLACAIANNTPVISDDKKVRKFCQINNIPIAGSLTVLKMAYRNNLFADFESYKETIYLLANDLYLIPELIEWALNM